MNWNSFRNIYIDQNNKKHLLDSTIIINDSIYENNNIQTFHLDNQINHLNALIYDINETELIKKNNIGINDFNIIPDTTKYIVEAKNYEKKNIALDNGSVDF